MRVERPVLADLALQAELLAIGGQDQLDGGRVEADAVVERLHVVALVDAADRHHRHQDVHRLDQARIAREQRFAEERLVRLHHVVDPGAGMSTRGRSAGSSTISLTCAITMPSRNAGGFHQRGGPRCWAGVEVAVAVGLVAGRQHDCGVRST
jgi:hypothetical protein